MVELVGGFQRHFRVQGGAMEEVVAGAKSGGVPRRPPLPLLHHKLRFHPYCLFVKIRHHLNKGYDEVPDDL